MNLLVVGATGTLGRQIVRRALDEGHEVHCLVRNLRKAAFLKEWGAHLIEGDLCEPETLVPALTGVSAVIDAATARPTDPQGLREVDWQGKVNLIQAAQAAGIERFVFFSIMAAEKYSHVPLMEIKRCTEVFLKESGLNYTILRPGGFYQGLIGQYAIPILEKQAVWVMGEASPIAYIDTQDAARFAVQTLNRAETSQQTFDLSGPKSWGPYEIIRLCERLTEREAKVWRMPVGLLRSVRRFTEFFEWGWNVADRLAFADVLTSGQALQSSMEEVYTAFDFDPAQTVTLEEFMQDYFSRILKKLKELDYEKNRQKQKSKKRSPFKTTKTS